MDKRNIAIAVLAVALAFAFSVLYAWSALVKEAGDSLFGESQ